MSEQTVYLRQDYTTKNGPLTGSVHWEIRVLDHHGSISVEALLADLTAARTRLLEDGVALVDIRVEIDAGTEPDYEGSLAVAHLAVIGQRPATPAEVEAEQVRRVEDAQRRKAREIAQVRARLAALEQGR